MSVSRPRSISMSSAGRSSQKGRRPSFLNDKGEVRLVENGFDLTPLPLLVDEAPPDEVEEVVAEREAETTQHDDEEETGTLWSSSYYSESGSDSDEEEKVVVPPVVTLLTESPTETLLCIRGRCVAVDAKEVKQVEQANVAYEASLDLKKNNPDKYVTRHAQTLNAPLKDRGSVTAPPSSSSAGTQATSYDIQDCIAQAVAEEEAELASRRPGTASKQQRINRNVYQNTSKVVAASKASPDFLLDVSEDRVESKAEKIKPSVREVPIQREIQGPERALLKEKFAKNMRGVSMGFSCAAMERCVQQNLYHERQMNYRAFAEKPSVQQELEAAEEVDEVEVEPTERGSSVEALWSWQAPMTKNRRVTCMAWNKHREDVLAVGYNGVVIDGSLPQDGGLVLFWSLRNPGYPERVASLEAGCSSIAFSAKNPHLLAVGLMDGAVYIYDVRQKTLQPTPVFDSRSLKNAHAEPVWSVAWVDKGEDKGEVLVTASTDGRVLEWTLSKGLEASCLMVLKQLGDAEGVISRTASGLCLDIPGDDPALYLTACEDGTIHKCSDAYAEQYLESYTGHTGPVYKVRSSPYDPKVFLSCSADWTVKLWTQSSSSPSASFRSEGSSPLNDVVNDVCWSPRASTQFALVGGDGRVEIWDVAHSLLDPVVREQPLVEPPPSADEAPPPPGTPMDKPPEPPAPISVAATACLFADNAPVLVVGDASGSVTCYKCVNLPAAPPTKKLQLSALEAALAPDEAQG
uniref:Dynein axonemal intermediate chain 4 n=2 Tax=Pelagomonas calceolata TaxID=35677 RepID=A0A7S4EBZ5_9STRA